MLQHVGLKNGRLLLKLDEDEATKTVDNIIRTIRHTVLK